MTKSGHLASHGAAVLKIAVISGVGILASFGFQIVTARSLGPGEFGILSAFFAIVSMAALGSSSLQNAIAVQTARAIAVEAPPRDRRALNGFTVETLVLGGAGAAIVAVGSPVIAKALHTEVYVPLLASIAILLSFVFVRGVGVIQGSGDSQGAVWWTTISLILRFVLVAVVFALGWGLVGALASVLVGSLLAVAGALVHAARLRIGTTHKPFRADGVVVLLMTLCFAWLTFADVVLVRAEASPTDAGVYAAGALLVKSVFLIPATLSLYLLPRFVRQEKDPALTRLGVRVTLAITTAGGVGTVAVFATVGPWAARSLLGAEYDIDRRLLVGLAIAYVPWVVAQGLLIRMNALASRTSLGVLAVTAVLLPAIGIAVLPEVEALLATLGVLGLVVLGSFLLVDFRHGRRRATSPVSGSTVRSE